MTSGKEGGTPTRPEVAGVQNPAPHTPQHPSEIIREKMDALDWGIPTMARKMGGDYGVNVLALEMYLYVGEREKGMRLGDAMTKDIARVLGVPGEFLQSMESRWIAHEKTDAPVGSAPLAEAGGSIPTPSDPIRDALVEALKELNDRVDAMWNDRDAPRPGAIHEFAICQAQQIGRAALSKAGR